MNRYVDRIRDELRKSFIQEYTPREVAGSFALGVFITMLPTLGVGLAVFAVLAFLFDRINKIAMFASVLVLNPAVKWGVYAASITLGFFLLGPVEGFDGGAVTLDAGYEVLVRLWVGNLILAVVATAIAYPLAYRMVTEYRARELEVVGAAVETVIDSFDESQANSDTASVDTSEQPHSPAAQPEASTENSQKGESDDHLADTGTSPPAGESTDN